MVVEKINIGINSCFILNLLLTNKKYPINDINKSMYPIKLNIFKHPLSLNFKTN